MVVLNNRRILSRSCFLAIFSIYTMTIKNVFSSINVLKLPGGVLEVGNFGIQRAWGVSGGKGMDIFWKHPCCITMRKKLVEMHSQKSLTF